MKGNGATAAAAFANRRHSFPAVSYFPIAAADNGDYQLVTMGAWARIFGTGMLSVGGRDPTSPTTSNARSHSSTSP